MGDLLNIQKKHEEVIETKVLQNVDKQEATFNIEINNPLLTKEKSITGNNEINHPVSEEVNLLIHSSEKTAERSTQLTNELMNYMKINGEGYDSARDALMGDSIWYSSKYMSNVKSNLKKLDNVMDKNLPQNLTEFRHMYRENCVMYEEVLFHCKIYLEKRKLTKKASNVQKRRHQLVRSMQHYLNIEYNRMKQKEEEICSMASEAIKNGTITTWRNIVRSFRSMPEDGLKGNNFKKEPLTKNSSEKLAASRLSLITGQGSLYTKSNLIVKENEAEYEYSVVTWDAKYDTNLDDILKLGEGKVIYSNEAIKKLQTLKVMDYLLGIKRTSGKGISVKTEPSRFNKNILIIKDINASFDDTVKSTSTSFEHNGLTFYDYSMIQGIVSLEEAGLNTLLGDVLDNKKIKDIKKRLKNIKTELSGKTGVMPLQDEAEWQAQLMAKKNRYSPEKNTNGANNNFQYVDMKYFHAGRVKNVLSKQNKTNKNTGTFRANEISNKNINCNLNNKTFMTHIKEISKDIDNILKKPKFKFQDRIISSMFISKDVNLFNEIGKLKDNKNLNISQIKEKLLELAFGNYTDSSTLEKLDTMADDPDIKLEEIYEKLEEIYGNLKKKKNEDEYLDDMLKGVNDYKNELDADDLDILRELEEVKGETAEKKKEVFYDIRKKYKMGNGLEHELVVYTNNFAITISKEEGKSVHDNANSIESLLIGMIKRAILYKNWAKDNVNEANKDVLLLADKIINNVSKEWKTELGDMKGLLTDAYRYIPLEKDGDKDFDEKFLQGASILIKDKLYTPKALKENNFESADIKLADMSDLPLFSKEPCSDDVNQSFVGDCYFQSALSALVSRDSSFIKNHMRDNGKTVTVKLYNEDKDGNRYPVNVTVNKTIPQLYLKHNSGKNKKSYMANDISVKGNNNLWVIMYEKAYIKSGFKKNNMELLKKQFPGLSKYNDKEKEKIIGNSFMWIEGGDPKAALIHLTGQGVLDESDEKTAKKTNNNSDERRYLNVISSTKNDNRHSFVRIKNMDFNELINKPDKLANSNNDQTVKNEIFYNVLKKSLNKEVEKRFTLKGVYHLSTYWHSVTRNVTKDDMVKILMDFRNWSGGKEYMDVVKLLRKENLSLKETEVDTILKSFIDSMSKTSWYQDLGHNCTNLDEEPHYDDYANSIYDDLTKRLKKGVVTCGTYGYHTFHHKSADEKDGEGINGEYMNIGVAEKHAYVINYVWVTDNGHKMISMTNPWGRSGLSYVKSKDASGKTTYSIKEQSSSEGGIFDLELNDFIRYVNQYT